MTSTATQLKDDIISYGGDEVSEIGENPVQFLIWLNNALVNSHTEICFFYNKWTTDSFTFSSKGYEQAVPTDWDRIAEISLYTDSDHQLDFIDWEINFGVIRFDFEQPSSKTFYCRYRKAPNVYTAMSDTIAETANPQCKKIIMEEVIAQYLSAQNDLESSNAEQSTLNKSNRNS